MLTHSFWNLNRDLIPRISCIWYCSVVYIAAVLFWEVFKHPSETCHLWENIPVVQECNSYFFFFFFFTFGRLVIPSFGRRPLHCWREEPDSCVLSLKVRIEMVTNNPWLSFGSSGLGCQGSTCTLEHLGTLSIFSPSPWWCARFSIPSQPFAAQCSPGIWKPGFGFSYISTAPKEGVSIPKEWSVDHRFLCFPHNTLIWPIKREPSRTVVPVRGVGICGESRSNAQKCPCQVKC